MATGFKSVFLGSGSSSRGDDGSIGWKERAIPHILLALAQLSFSGWHIVGSLSLGMGADALVFALYREILATISMFIYAYAVAPTATYRLVERIDLPRFLFLGFCSFINVVFSILSLQYISASKYAMLQPAIPCFACLISVIVGLEGWNVLKGLGISAAVAGAVIIEAWKPETSSKDASNDKNETLGMTLVVIQTFTMACVVVFQKSILSKYEPQIVAFVFYGIGTLFTILLCLCWASRFSDAADFSFHSNLLPWLALVYATLFATLFAYNAISWSGKKLPPSITTVYSTLQPFGTVILSWLILKSSLTLNEGIGGTCVLVGLVATVIGRQRELAVKTASGTEAESGTEEGVVFGPSYQILEDESGHQRHAESRSTLQ